MADITCAYEWFGDRDILPVVLVIKNTGDRDVDPLAEPAVHQVLRDAFGKTLELEEPDEDTTETEIWVDVIYNVAWFNADLTDVTDKECVHFFTVDLAA
jgi:hypothetical protein